MNETKPVVSKKSYAVYVLTERMTAEGQRTFWTRIGAAFKNADASMTVRLDALPLSGTLQIREEDADARATRRKS